MHRTILALDAEAGAPIIARTGAVFAATSATRRGFFLAGFVKKVTKSRGRPGGMDFDLSTYYPIFIYLLAILAFAAGSLTVAHLVAPRRKTPVKLMPYESGMDPVGDARQRFDVKFYLIAILFLVFDVELLFLSRWAVAAYRGGDEPLLPGDLKTVVFWEVLVFMATLAVAYVYAWRKGVFRWR